MCKTYISLKVFEHKTYCGVMTPKNITLTLYRSQNDILLFSEDLQYPNTDNVSLFDFPILVYGVNFREL